MAILFSNEIIAAVTDELRNASQSVQIITAYCKDNSLMHLNKFIGESVIDKRLLLRFRMDDVIKGSTDFSVLESAIETGWKVYLRFDLHAKTYVIDNKRGFVGSANATNSGLSMGKAGNMEMATLIDIEAQDIDKIARLFNDAILVDDMLIDKLKNQMELVKDNKGKDSYMWDESITQLFNPHIDTLFSHELPECFTLTKGEYVSFIDEIFDGNREKLKHLFRWSNAYLWLLGTLKENDGCMYFGALTERLHNSLISDPKPFRRELKPMLSNLLNFITELDMDEIIIDRPNYSQRVRIK